MICDIAIAFFQRLLVVLMVIGSCPTWVLYPDVEARRVDFNHTEDEQHLIDGSGLTSRRWKGP